MKRLRPLAPWIGLAFATLVTVVSLVLVVARPVPPSKAHPRAAVSVSVAWRAAS